VQSETPETVFLSKWLFTKLYQNEAEQPETVQKLEAKTSKHLIFKALTNSGNFLRPKAKQAEAKQYTDLL
jgi:hypothetical protein